jgi:glutathione synthase/RimK-type ligase-like ATP-grasp enzyme
MFVLTDADRKKNSQIFFEYFKSLLTNHIVAEQYFYKFLYHKDVININDYIVTREIQKKSWVLNDPDYISILDNKLLFELYYSDCKLPVVKSIAHNTNRLFFRDNQLILVNSFKEFTGFLSDLLKDVSGAEGLFIKKKEGSAGGRNIYKITKDEIIYEHDKLIEIYNHIIKSSYLIQDIIVQHEEMNRLNSCCVNTIRFDTFTNKQNQSQLFSCFLRIGLKKSCVDNVSSGGAYIGVDINTGILSTDALTDFTHGKGKTYHVHPENNVKFVGFQIPFYKEAKELVLEAANRLPHIRVVGWDIAIMPDGPVLVEGNELPGIVFSEISQKGFKNNPVFLELYQELKAIR